MASEVKRTRLTASAQLQLDRSVFLGKGRSAVVFQGSLEDSKVAIKRVISPDVHPDWINDATDKKLLSIMQLDHPNVLKLLDVDSDDDFKYFVLELCLGTVYDYARGTYKEQVPAPAEGLHQMASGLSYLHSKDLVHGDIKPENVLISSAVQLKISDFGFCKPISNRGSMSMSSGSRGSPSCQAPELLNSEEDDDQEPLGPTKDSDIFALGCVFFTYLNKTGHPFMSGGSRHSILPNIIDGKYNLDPLSEDNLFAKEIIKEMIQAEPDKRIRLEDVIKKLDFNLIT